jgi:hypothetical protein
MAAAAGSGGAGHWHVWRITAHPAWDQSGTLDVEGYFFLDRFADTGAAGAGLVADVLDRYPQVKRYRGVAELRALAANPDAGVLYRTGGGVVQWRLEECAGDCARTREVFSANVREYFRRFIRDCARGLSRDAQ